MYFYLYAQCIARNETCQVRYQCWVRDEPCCATIICRQRYPLHKIQSEHIKLNIYISSSVSISMNSLLLVMRCVKWGMTLHSVLKRAARLWLLSVPSAEIRTWKRNRDIYSYMYLYIYIYIYIFIAHAVSFRRPLSAEYDSSSKLKSFKHSFIAASFGYALLLRAPLRMACVKVEICRNITHRHIYTK